jgi:hypothetical protein
MMTKIIVSAHTDHLDWIASNMREADEIECAAGAMSPRLALERSMETSVKTWTGMIMPDARPICMFGVGVGDILGAVGHPWCLGTDEIEDVSLSFLRESRKVVARMLGIFPYLFNYVDARNELSIKWLKWLGFKFDDQTVAYGPFKIPFYRFEMRLCAYQ